MNSYTFGVRPAWPQIGESGPGLSRGVDGRRWPAGLPRLGQSGLGQLGVGATGVWLAGPTPDWGGGSWEWSQPWGEAVDSGLKGFAPKWDGVPYQGSASGGGAMGG